MTDQADEKLAREFAVEIEEPVIKLAHIATAEVGCPHFEDSDPRSCNDCQGLRVRSVLENRVPALLQRVREKTVSEIESFEGGPYMDAPWAVKILVRQREEKRDAEWVRAVRERMEKSNKCCGTYHFEELLERMGVKDE